MLIIVTSLSSQFIKKYRREGRKIFCASVKLNLICHLHGGIHTAAMFSLLKEEKINSEYFFNIFPFVIK